MPRNSGQHSALLCGIRAASSPLLVTLDDDLRHPPEEMGLLIEELGRGFDVVYGSSRHQQHEPLRVLASRLSKLALKRAMGVGVAPHVSAFRAFRTNLREAFSGDCGSFVSIDVLLTWATTRFSAVDVRHDARFKGHSQYTLKKLATHGLNMMTGFSVLPLQVASLLGLTFTAFGLGVQAYVLGRWMVHGSVVPGFAFLASIITIFSGAQLFALGIIGGNLARMHSRLMDRPPYVIASHLIEPIIEPETVTLREIDEAIIRCYRDFYMAKMASFHKYPDAFRRRYMLSSMKLIMKSSFIVENLGRLGMPAAMAKILAATTHRQGNEAG